MDQADIQLRNETYRTFLAQGEAPTAADMAERRGSSVAEVEAGWRRLHDAHALVLDDTGRLQMLNPFAMRRTPFRVLANGRWWYANCAWDAFGIGAALDVDSVIETECADCRTPIRIRITDGRPDDLELVFHVLVPAVDWWTDIGFT